MSSDSRFRSILRLAAGMLSIVMIVALVQALRHDGPAALDAWRTAQVRWTWVSVAVACALAGHTVYVIGWRRLLKDSGIDASFWQLARLFLVSNLGRYLPAGKAWQMAIVAMMAAEQELPPAPVAASSLFQGVTGVGVGAVVLFAAGGATIGLPPAWLALPVAGIVGLLASPTILRSLPPLHRVIAQRVPGIDSVTTATMWALIWTSAASWILWGLALYALGSALLPVPAASIAACVAAWTGSFLAGLIAVVSPAGLGAREGVMQAVFGQAGMAPANILVLVVVARAWVTLLDVVPAAIVLILRGNLRRSDAPLLPQPVSDSAL